jgi:negative regulator of sigma E activity
MTTDKIDTHYHQQLSALMDGDLPPDEARFLLRRLQHDNELTGCWERWQLCGDVLRGQAQAPAPAGFADRVAAAIAAEAVQPVVQATPARTGNRLAKWGGGALAASVAMVALFMVRQQIPDETPAPTTASTSSASRAAPSRSGSATPALQAAAVTAASVAVASVPRQNNSSPRRSATRTQQASRQATAVRTPDRAVAVAAAAVPVIHAIASTPANSNASQRNPFSNVQINPPAARPWPRAVAPQYGAGSGAFTAGFSNERTAQDFYPFEPRSTEPAPAAAQEPVQQEQ